MVTCKRESSTSIYVLSKRLQKRAPAVSEEARSSLVVERVHGQAGSVFSELITLRVRVPNNYY